MSAMCSHQFDRMGLDDHVNANDSPWAAAMTCSNIADVPQVDLGLMAHEAHIRHIGEDWAGITNQKQRKRLQNRLNQRAGE